MAQITIAEAGRRWNVSRSTLNRYLKKGQISAVKQGRYRKIDTSEMLRVFGEPNVSHEVDDTVSGETQRHTVAHSEVVDELRNQVKQLEKQLDRSQNSEGELRDLLKREQDNFKVLVDGRENSEKTAGLFTRMFGKS
jgi:excisionase family DNA binding protein